MKNNRAFLEKLLDGAEVEWKTLDEIFYLKNGYTPSKGVKEYWENGSIPWFRMEDIRENGRILNTALQKVSESAVKGGKLFPANSIIIATSATIGEHALITIPFLANQRFTVLSLKPEYIDKFNIYFLYHYCFTLDNWCQKNTTMSSFASVDMNGFRKFPIPIPPLSVQTEIVRILDALTALTSELILRQKQYEYYREKLLSEEELEKVGFEWKTLDQISENLDSKRKPITSGLRTSGKIPYYGASGIVDYVKDYIFDGDFLLISEDGANLLARNTPIAFSASGKIWVNNHAHILKFETYEERRFIEFYLNKIDLTPYISGAAQPKLNKKNLNSIKFPIPSIPEQQRIVSILDKFETLTNSITEGLPLAIEQSHKRYEYYRELLLSFNGSN